MWGNSHIFFFYYPYIICILIHILYTKTKAIQWGEAKI
nr:MAG TPA: hypothetical protein [Caudoviricetes sp.]